MSELNLDFLGKEPRYKSRLKEVNPMVVKYGLGPDDKRCKDCEYLVGYRQSKVWYKCKLRGVSKSEATDHRVNWETCSKFSPETGREGKDDRV